jgi:hypothetical protein
MREKPRKGHKLEKKKYYFSPFMNPRMKNKN